MITKPGTVPTPNEFYDVALKELSFPQFKIYAFIIRKTIGWHKLWDKISISQLQEGTRVSRSTIITSIGWLEEHGWIISKYQCTKCQAIREIIEGSCGSCGWSEPPDKMYSIIAIDEEVVRETYNKHSYNKQI